MIVVKGSAIASSVHKDQRMRYSPTFAIDGKWETRTYNMYTSKKEKMPWLQWKLPNRTKVAGVSISSEYGISKLHDNTTHKNDLVNYEVRAGLSSLPANYKGRILKNVRCGSIEIRGGEDRVYPIVCDQAIIANYITIQIIVASDQNIRDLVKILNRDGYHQKPQKVIKSFLVLSSEKFLKRCQK